MEMYHQHNFKLSTHNNHFWYLHYYFVQSAHVMYSVVQTKISINYSIPQLISIVGFFSSLLPKLQFLILHFFSIVGSAMSSFQWMDNHRIQHLNDIVPDFSILKRVCLSRCAFALSTVKTQKRTLNSYDDEYIFHMPIG